LVEQEPGTTYWAAVELPGTNVFGIIDAFKDEAGRDAHLNGKVAEALFANVDTLLEAPPDVVKSAILAGVLNQS
jgi:quinol monooxygenase YgiN